MAKILIVEDDVKIARFVELELRHEGYETETATDGRTGLMKALEPKTDLVLLDIMLPELSGMEVCRRIRQESTVPVIMLTAKGDVTDKVAGLDMGANDYMTKPFGIRELLARVKANLRRTEIETQQESSDPQEEMNLGELNINFTRYEVSKNGNIIDLTLREFELLKFLSLQPEKIYSREALLEKISNNTACRNFAAGCVVETVEKPMLCRKEIEQRGIIKGAKAPLND